MISVWKFGALLWAKDVIINTVIGSKFIFPVFVGTVLCVEGEFQNKENKV